MSLEDNLQQEILEKYWEAWVESTNESTYWQKQGRTFTLEDAKEDSSTFSSAMWELRDMLGNYPDGWETSFGTVTLDASVGGGEGEGETMYAVFKLTTHSGEERFFRSDGYYESWDGGSWEDNDLYEVDKVPVGAFDYPPKR